MADQASHPAFRSLRLRMALSHGVVLAFIILALGGTGYVLLALSLDHAASASVVAAAREAAERAVQTQPFSAPADNDVPSTAAIRVAVFLPGGAVLGEAGETPPWLRPQSSATDTIHAFGEPVRVATLPVLSHGREVATVVAAKSLAPEARLLSRVRLLLWLGGLVAVLASMAAGWVLAGRAVRPARQAYEAQASFASNASHELRTPLAFVRAGVEVLAEHEPELGKEVLHDVDYLTGLTERLLAVARAESGSLALQTSRVDVAALCRRSVERNRKVLPLAAQVFSDEPVTAMTDAVALEAVLDALLENVARHGGNRAEISCEQGGGQIRIKVVDRGRGMSAADRSQAFEKFFRADPSRRHDRAGAGLGLPLARALVEAQRGELRLEDTPGGGLTVILHLPRSVVEDVEPGVPAAQGG